MKRQTKTLLALALTLAMTSGSLGVFAAFQDSVKIKNNLALGDVNISLKEYKRKNQREYPYQNSQTVLPGDTVSKIPRIINKAEPCWVRVRLGFSGIDNKKNMLSENNILGMNEVWVKRGDYFYYTKILEEQESVDVFSGIKIPEAWDSSYSLLQTDVTIHAQAVQAANFTPDFSAMSPWGNLDVEKCVHADRSARYCKNENLQLRVEFEKNAHRLLAVPGDFFHNFDTVMPGDICRDTIALSNTTEHMASLYFRTEQESLTEKQREVREQLSLTIWMDKERLYSGNLAAKELSEPIFLGEFPADAKGDMEFEIKVPKELKNTYALRDTKVIWVFSLEEDGILPTETLLQNKEPSERTPSVKTEDESHFFLHALLLLCSISAVTAIAVIQKGGKAHEK